MVQPRQPEIFNVKFKILLILQYITKLALYFTAYLLATQTLLISIINHSTWKWKQYCTRLGPIFGSKFWRSKNAFRPRRQGDQRIWHKINRNRSDELELFPSSILRQIFFAYLEKGQDWGEERRSFQFKVEITSTLVWVPWPSGRLLVFRTMGGTPE